MAKKPKLLTLGMLTEGRQVTYTENDEVFRGKIVDGEIEDNKIIIELFKKYRKKIGADGDADDGFRQVPVSQLEGFEFIETQLEQDKKVELYADNELIAETKTSKKPKKTKEEKEGSTISVLTGEGITDTWNRLLVENLTAHLTEKELSEKYFEHFPKLRKHQPLDRIRSFFNTGRYGFGLSPKYTELTNEDGEVELIEERQIMPENRRALKYDENGNVIRGGGKSGKSKKVSLVDSLLADLESHEEE